jgi:hypothetical protein
MARGLAVPVGVTASGGSRTVEGDAQAEKIIALALADNDNTNAFQQNIGLGVRDVFDVANRGTRARVLARVVEIFAAFEKEKLFKLVRGSVAWKKGETGDQVLEFKYINLESDEVRAFSRTFTARSRA